MTVEIVGEDSNHKYRETCTNCAVVLEYTKRDRVIKRSAGGIEMGQQIFCPRCGFSVECHADKLLFGGEDQHRSPGVRVVSPGARAGSPHRSEPGVTNMTVQDEREACALLAESHLKDLEKERSAASYSGSYEGQVIASEKIDLVHRIATAIRSRT